MCANHSELYSAHGPTRTAAFALRVPLQVALPGPLRRPASASSKMGISYVTGYRLPAAKSSYCQDLGSFPRCLQHASKAKVMNAMQSYLGSLLAPGISLSDGFG
jgi:hypothetical protein